MKKLLLTAFGIAGIVSAKDNVIKNSETIEILKTKVTAGTRCGIVQATCTSAYTCQDWTDAQFTEWAEQIQNNYCQLW